MDIQDIISSGLLELYAAGLASPQEQEQVAQWLQQYPEVAAEYEAIQSGIAAYAQENAVAPNAATKEKIFAVINTAPSSKSIVTENNSNQAKVIPFKNNWKWVAAASIVLLLGSAAMNMMYYNKYDTASKNLKDTEAQLALAQKSSNDMKTDMAVVHSPLSMPVSLKAMPEAPDATAKIFWMQDTKEVMIDASNLPEAPSGMQYQFWGIVDGKPVDGGMIITNDKGIKYRMQKMKSFGKAEAFAISLEKAGGNPIPTKVVSMGKII